MRAHVHDGVNRLRAEPQMERDIGMTRRAGEIVIVRVTRIRLAALGLNRDDRSAASNRRKLERAVSTAWIVFRRAPGAYEIILQGLRKARERGAVIGHLPSKVLIEQRLAERADRLDIEAGLCEIGHQGLDRRERIEANRMRDLVRTTRIVREHDRQPLLAARLLGEKPPSRDAHGNSRHALRIGPVREM